MAKMHRKYDFCIRNLHEILLIVPFKVSFIYLFIFVFIQNKYIKVKIYNNILNEKNTCHQGFAQYLEIAFSNLRLVCVDASHVVM